jgi:hypothetical protein
MTKRQLFLLCFVATVSFITTSCSIFTSVSKKAEVQEKMANYSESEPYPFTLPEMKAKIENSLNRRIFDGHLVLVSTPGFQDHQTMQKINDDMEEGFFYKEKFYTSTWSFSETISELTQAKDHMFRAKYHILEDSTNGFVIVKGSTIYEATKVGDEKTKLKISKLTGIIRPMNINFDWWNLIKRKGLSFSFESNPVDLEQSQKYAVLDRNQMLDFFYFVEEDKAMRMERELK